MLLFNPRLIASAFLNASSAAAVGGIALVGNSEDVDGFVKRTEKSKGGKPEFEGVTDDDAIEVDVWTDGSAVGDIKVVYEVTLVLVIFELVVCSAEKVDAEVIVTVNVSIAEPVILLEGVET
jgi:hypothetical protein